MSSAGEGRRRVTLPEEVSRLERAGEAAARALETHIRQLEDAHAEVDRLRRVLEAWEGDSPGSGPSGHPAEELARLRDENVALKRRMTQARKRIDGLIQRLAALEVER